MDAIELLESDHRRVSDCFEQMEQTGNVVEKHRLFERARQELETHSHIEEAVLYPMFARHDEFRELVVEFQAAHQEIRELLDEIGIAFTRVEDPEKAEEVVEDRIDELVECFDDHVDEEENEFFPRMREYLTSDELNQLGSDLEIARNEFPVAA